MSVGIDADLLVLGSDLPVFDRRFGVHKVLNEIAVTLNGEARFLHLRTPLALN